MKAITSLKAILVTAVVGIIFSGYLTYQELFAEGDQSCGAAEAGGMIFGYPPCVYGLFMYVVVSLLAWLGLRKVNK